MSGNVQGKDLSESHSGQPSEKTGVFSQKRPNRIMGLLESSRNRSWPFVLLLVVVMSLAYLPALSGKFVWDDDSWTTNIVGLLSNISGLRHIWCQPTALQQYYPLTGTTFWVDYHLWGFWTPPYHIENLLLHILAALVTRVAGLFRAPASLYGFAAVMLAVFTTLTWRQCGIYADIETLWGDTPTKNSGAWLAAESGCAGPVVDDVLVSPAARLAQSPKANTPTKNLMDDFIRSSILRRPV